MLVLLYALIRYMLFMHIFSLESETQRGHLLGEVYAHPFAVSGFA